MLFDCRNMSACFCRYGDKKTTKLRLALLKEASISIAHVPLLTIQSACDLTDVIREQKDSDGSQSGILLVLV